MAKATEKQQRKTSNVEHESVEPKNNGSKNVKSSGKTEKGCRNCK